MHRSKNFKHIVIVSPALSDANNGNWQTAKRWAHLLAPHYRTRIVREWPGTVTDTQAQSDEIMLALHARRSASAVAAWQAQRGSSQLVVVLTGTDLYRDIHIDTQAKQSLDAAARLIVLQPLGIKELPSQHHSKARVVLQSTSSRKTLPKTTQRLRALMVGHLRDEKSPQTLFAAAHLLRAREDIYIAHIGAGLDDGLTQEAISTAADCVNYTWLGALPHPQTRAKIQRAHVLVHASKMEGGAHVVMEAVCSGTPVIASAIPGNVGMLGEDYCGYFPVGDAAALALLLERCKDEPQFIDALRSQCALRAPLFAPQAELTALLQVIQSL
jgi:putative glycosyltransferase (TIGR04348 family)